MSEASDEIIKGLVKEALVKAVVKKLIIAAPIFGLPVLNPVTVYLIGKLFEFIYDEVALFMAITKIDMDVEEHRREYERAKEDLRIKLESEDEEARKKAEEEFDRRLGDLIKFPHAA